MDATSQESYAAVALNKDAEYGKITVTGTTFNIQDDSLKALVVAPNGEITIDGLTDEVSIHEAIINYGNYCASFETVAEAIDAAQDGETVVLLKDIELDETVIIAQGKNITLDLAGNTISGTDNSTKNFALISINKGELTIEDSVGEGAITLKATNDNGYSRFSSVVSNNQGILTVKSGTIQHLGGHTMAYAIDSLTNGGSGDVVTTILGGTLKSSYVAIRQFGNSDVNENALLISGGTIEGDNTSIFIQSPNTKQNVISLSISGGSINNRIYGSFEQSNEIDVLVSGGTFANINIVGTEVSLDECLTSGFELAQNANGKFEVTNAAPESSVAQNGKVSYADLQKAIEAVEDGETITLLKDVTVTTPAYGQNALNIDRAVNFTIDLNGKTLSSDVGNSVVRFNIAGANATSDVTVTIKNGKVVSGANTWCALMASAPDASAKAIMNLQDLVVGNSKAGDFAIKAWENSIINATNVAVSSTNCAGGFYAVGGEMVLDNCIVNQKGLHTAPYTSMALGVSNNGKMTVNSGTYSSEPTSAEEGNNQGTSHGSWCAGIMNSGGTLIINGGTFTNGNYGDDSLATYARGLLCLDTGAALTINGGTFNALDSVIYITNNLGDASKNPTAVVKGGKYSTLKNSGYASEMVNYLPDEFLIIGNEADGYVVENENDTIAVAKIGKYGYTTIQKAINAAQVGETVTIFAGQYNETVSVNKDITVVGEDRDQVIINGKLNVTGNGAEVKNLSVTSSGNAVYVNGKDILIENCNIKGSNGLRSCYAKGLVTIKDSTITGDVYGIHFDGSKGGEVVIDNCVITGWTSFASSISKVTIADSKFEEGNYNQLRFYQNAELTNTEFNPEMTIDFGKGGVESSFDGCTVSDGSSLLDVIYLPDIAQMGVKVEVDNQQIIVEAMIGEKTYSTVAEAFEAAVDGDEVEIYVAGTYALSTSGKNITITGAVDGVVFDNIGAKNMGGADVTFNNVTFDYYPNKNYTGLQHSGNLTYNNCTFEGQVFLYGVSETFNECTFNQNSKDAYNVWTYGADAVEFNKCTFIKCFTYTI